MEAEVIVMVKRLALLIVLAVGSIAACSGTSSSPSIALPTIPPSLTLPSESPSSSPSGLLSPSASPSSSGLESPAMGASPSPS